MTSDRNLDASSLSNQIELLRRQFLCCPPNDPEADTLRSLLTVKMNQYREATGRNYVPGDCEQYTKD
jgi:hypothetical protein